MDLKVLSTLLATLALSGCVMAAPQVPPREYAGILVGETRWSGEVTLADDVIIPVGSSLHIAPGTRVRVRSTESTKIEPEQLSSATELLVRGSLDALGEKGAPIEFTVETQPGDTIAWAGIIADRAARVRIEHAHIAQAEQGVWLVASPGTVKDCEFRACRYGLVFQRPAAQEVRGNRIVAGEAGVFCWLGADPHLQGNTIRGQVEEGVFVDATSHPRLLGNVIRDNGVGLVASDPALAEGNEIAGNGVDLLPLGGGR